MSPYLLTFFCVQILLLPICVLQLCIMLNNIDLWPILLSILQNDMKVRKTQSLKLMVYYRKLKAHFFLFFFDHKQETSLMKKIQQILLIYYKKCRKLYLINGIFNNNFDNLYTKKKLERPGQASMFYLFPVFYIYIYI
jgi:hypothetical protein